MWILPLLIKATLVLAVTVALLRFFRRASSSAIHFVWVLAFTALLALPLLSMVLPALRVPVLYRLRGGEAASVTVSQTFTAIPFAPLHEGFRFDWILIAWIAGVFAVALQSLSGALAVRRIARGSTPFPSRFSPVPLFISDREIMPMVWGLRGPSILLPASAREWQEAKLRMVLWHELAHVTRRDLWTQVLARVVTAIYWPHPLAWWASREMRRRSEMACDDRVLSAGIKPSDYATELLEVARSLSWRKNWTRAAFAMARPSNLEGRLLAILDGRPRVANRRGIVVAATVLLAVALPSAALQFGQRRIKGIGIWGNVYDPSGSLVANAAVFVSGPGGSMRTLAPAGSFAFDSLAPGVYRVEILKAGFEPSLSAVRVTAGPSDPRDFFLRTGSIEERLTVAERGTPAPGTRPKRIRVGGNMQHARLITMLRPLYPKAAKLRGASGIVAIRAEIGKDGIPEKLTVLNSPGDDFSNAALEAVSKWRYSPTLLNGEPIAIETVIDINFTLRR